MLLDYDWDYFSIILGRRDCFWYNTQNTMTKIISDQYNPLDMENGDEVTLRSRWMIGVWQWWSRDVASHISQNILSTSYSLKPQPSLSFICWMTQPDTQTDTSSVSTQVISIQTDMSPVSTCVTSTQTDMPPVSRHVTSTQTDLSLVSARHIKTDRSTHYQCQHVT